ncbi:GNAT family N-acetyltransferase [Pseudomonas farsensis]|uniref:GNAT family N-acetyltransferase n=1 Tax=Pseudomonas farsensis TaxID=2745492 RepID=UPI001CECAFE4|nr:GNAT family N-acetyltransferase [Pseudomonas farsensis]
MRQETACPTEALELSPPEKLGSHHVTDKFNCNEPSINDYLWSKALKAQNAKHAMVYVVCFKGTHEVAAYYTLSNSAIDRRHGATAKIRRNAPDPLPVTVLGRMGVTEAASGRGLSVALLADAIERCIIASEVIGSTALIVHPLNDRLTDFYAKHAGFIPCPDLAPMTMMLPLR